MNMGAVCVKIGVTTVHDLLKLIKPYFVYNALFSIQCRIIESVDSISRDGPDTPLYVIHYKKRNDSEQVSF